MAPLVWGAIRPDYGSATIWRTYRAARADPPRWASHRPGAPCRPQGDRAKTEPRTQGEPTAPWGSRGLGPLGRHDERAHAERGHERACSACPLVSEGGLEPPRPLKGTSTSS